MVLISWWQESEFGNGMVKETLVIWSVTEIHMAASACVCFNAVSRRTFCPYDLMQGVCYIKKSYICSRESICCKCLCVKSVCKTVVQGRPVWLEECEVLYLCAVSL